MLRIDFFIFTSNSSVILFPRTGSDAVCKRTSAPQYYSSTRIKVKQVIRKSTRSFRSYFQILHTYWRVFRKVGKIAIYSSTVSTIPSSQVYQFVNRLFINLAPIALIHPVTALIQSSVTELWHSTTDLSFHDHPASRTWTYLLVHSCGKRSPPASTWTECFGLFLQKARLKY